MCCSWPSQKGHRSEGGKGSALGGTGRLARSVAMMTQRPTMGSLRNSGIGNPWIDEATPPKPGSERSRARVAAEDGWRALGVAAGKSVHILRLAGIYGPGRIPRKADLLAGKPVNADPDGYLNLIHVDDAAGIVLAVTAQAAPPRVYLVADGRPVLRRDYFAFDPANPESTWNDDSGNLIQYVEAFARFQIAGLYPRDLNFSIQCRTRMGKGLFNTHVSVVQLDIFANDRD